jgi:AcrR family transcriptional regulator
VSHAYRAERRDRILTAAMARFAREGFHATSMADVIDEAGMSAGGVYRYFEGKEALIEAIVERLLERLQVPLEEAIANVDSAADAIGALLAATSRAFRDPADPSARLVPQMWTEALRDERVRARAAASYAQVLRRLSELAERLDDLPSGMTAAGAAHVWLALMQGYTLQRLMLGAAFDDAAFREAARAAFRPG